MVVELTDGLARCPDNKIASLSISIENLLLGYYEGNLILMISSPLCRFIRSKGLVRNERAIWALQAIEEGGGFVPDVLWRLQVVLDNPDPLKHEVCFSFFSRMMAVLPAAFLCENIEDVRFYMRLSRLYYPGTPISAMCYHGGGGTTVDVFSYLRKIRVVCLVILDSDIKYPGCKKGETAKRCLAKYKTSVGYIEVKMLDVHEAENLVPLEFMKKHASRKGKALLKLMSERKELDNLVYYDVKHGIRKSDVDQDTKYKEYCCVLYNKLYKPRKNTFDHYLSQKKSDLDYLFDQIAPQLLEDFNRDKSLAYSSDIMSPYRKRIAQLVHTFICCRGNEPLN